MKGTVYKIHSDFYYVKPENGENTIIECKLREVLKKQKLKIKVGDFVSIENKNAICKLLPRKNTLERPSVSNLDMVVVVSSLLEPKVDYRQLNRYLIFLKHYKIPAILCFNKDDLTDEKEFIRYKKEIESIYKPLRYKIFFTSAISLSGLSEFKSYIKNKTIAFCGLSGVGKSSILSALSKKNIKTGDVSEKNKRGTHTTRHSEIIEFDDIKIIDTPGFSRLVFNFILPKDLSELFDEIKDLKKECKYKDCLHTKDDKNCNVIKNLDKIHPSRYESYLDFLKEAHEFKQKTLYESQKEETTTKNNMKKTFTKISSKKKADSRKKTNQTTKNIRFDIERENHD